MNGKLERDLFGHLLCDLCRKTSVAYRVAASPLLTSLITNKVCKRKFFYLCLECARSVSPKLLEVYLK